MIVYLRNFKNALEVTKQYAILGEQRDKTEEVNQVQNTHNVTQDSVTNNQQQTEESIPPSYRPTAIHLKSFLNKNKNFEVQNQELK